MFNILLVYSSICFKFSYLLCRVISWVIPNILGLLSISQKCICKAQACKNSWPKRTSHSLQMPTATTLRPLNGVVKTLNRWLNILAECGRCNEGNKREMCTTCDYTLKWPYSSKALLIEANEGQLVLKVWVAKLETFLHYVWELVLVRSGSNWPGSKWRELWWAGLGAKFAWLLHFVIVLYLLYFIKSCNDWSM